MNELWTWIEERPEVLRWMALGSVVTFLGSLLALPWMVARLPADHFVLREVVPRPGSPPRRIVVFVLRNLLGALLVASGLAMLVLPGQGILTILVGLSVAEFPGKRWLERQFVRSARVRAALDWLRRRARRPPFVYGEDHSPPSSPAA